MATFSQIKRIHTIKNALGLDDDLYRDMLASFDVQSSKDLTETEANILIEILYDKQKTNYKKRFNTLHYRDKEMATPYQLRKIEVMWSEFDCTENRKKSLRTFMKNKFGVSDLRFVTKKIASSLIFVIEKMVRKKALKGV